MHPPVGGAGNLGPSLRFHYLPDDPLNDRRNVESTEYANIVLSFARFWSRARAAGMPAPRSGGRTLLRRWTTARARRRLDARRVPQLGQRARFQPLAPGQEARAHATGADRGRPGARVTAVGGVGPLGQVAAGSQPRLVRRATGGRSAASPTRSSSVSRSSRRASAAQRSARCAVQANAARAVEAGLGRLRGTRPPALYAYDPDIGRLAITTPAYNTAIVAVNQRAFPYGGIELRATVRRQPACGRQHRRRSATPRSACASATPRAGSSSRPQTARPAVSRSVTPLRLTRAPSGVRARAASSRGRSYAGRFRVLEARGSMTRRQARVATTHRFTSRAITTTWRVGAAAGRGRTQHGRAVPELGWQDRRHRGHARRHAPGDWAASGSPRSHVSRSAAATRSSRSCARRAPSRASATRRASPPSRTRARRWSWRSRGALVSTASASPRESFPDFRAPFAPAERSNADHAPAPLTRGRTTSRTRRPATGAQGGSHARPAARAALRAAPARIRGELAHPCVRVRRRGLPPIRRPDAGAARRPVERAARHLRAGAGRRRRARQRRAAAHAQRRRAGRARRARRATTSARGSSPRRS